MTYGKMHRFFLRTVASQGVLSISDAQAIMEKYNEAEELLSVIDLVKAINDEIRPYYQEIKITQDVVTNDDVVVFLSLADDAATKAQGIFSTTELEYFRVLIEHIMSTESRQITGIHAMNLVSSMKASFTKTDAQKVLNTWCRMRYFDKVQDNYALGVRAIHEFEGYFKQNMPHAVEECFLCKHVVFRGYNCPGCGHAVDTKCLLRYIERVQKWPCCKIDFEQAQLERLNTEGSRLPPSQHLDTTRQSEVENTVAEPTQDQESSELMDETQEVIPEISQRVTRKRKRQISPQTQSATARSTPDNSTVVPTTRSTKNDAVEKPAQVLTTPRPTTDNIVEEPTQVPTTRSTRNTNVAKPIQEPTVRHSTQDDIFKEPAQVTTTRRATKNSTVGQPAQVLTAPQPTKANIVEEPTQVTTTRRATRNSTVAEPAQVRTTRRSSKDNIVEEPIQVPSTRRATRNSTVVEPAQVRTTRRSSKDNIVEEPIQVPTTRRATRNSTVAEPAQVRTTRRSSKDNIVEEPTQVPNTNNSKNKKPVAKPTQVPTTRRSTRNNFVAEPIIEVQESKLDVTDEVVPEVTQRTTRKRKQQM